MYEILNGLAHELETDSFERLKWLVMREFAIAPGSRAARRLRAGDVLYCAFNMLLDSGREAPVASGNPAFDQDRFKMLGGVSGEEKI